MPGGKVIEETGNTYSRLTVLGKSHKTKRGWYWKCLCECGNQTVVHGSNLRSGNTKSCSCLSRDKAKSRTTHRHTINGILSLTYRSWADMRQRCNNSNDYSYKYYGERGIEICDRWQNFENFLEDMGERDSDKVLDRIDVDGNYTPENCRWATASTSVRNRRKRKNTSSQFRGVSWNKSSQKWAAYITVNGKMNWLGRHDTEKEAALTYDKVCWETFKEKQYLNFP